MCTHVLVGRGPRRLWMMREDEEVEVEAEGGRRKKAGRRGEDWEEEEGGWLYLKVAIFERTSH